MSYQSFLKVLTNASIAILSLGNICSLGKGKRNGFLKRQWIVPVLSSALFLGLVCGRSQAYTVVTISSAAPAGLEASFVQDIATRYQAQVVPNPLVSNTWSVKLQGINPNYNPPPSNLDLLNAMVTVDSTTYLYGYRDGAGYEEHVDASIAGNYALNCSTPLAGIPTYDVATCQAVAGMINAAIFQQYNSTITVINGF